MVNRFFNRCWCFAVALLVLALLGQALRAFGVNANVAILVKTFGTPVILVSIVAYIIFIDSKKRWPQVSAIDRFVRVMTCNIPRR